MLSHKQSTKGKEFYSEYQRWKAMRRRCYLKTDKDYKNYGERGIKVCKRWDKFENFIKDMGKCPKGFSLDRIDSNGNYEPKNCKWSSAYEQSRNRRTVPKITKNGITKTANALNQYSLIVASLIFILFPPFYPFYNTRQNNLEIHPYFSSRIAYRKRIS